MNHQFYAPIQCDISQMAMGLDHSEQKFHCPSNNLLKQLDLNLLANNYNPNYVPKNSGAASAK